VTGASSGMGREFVIQLENYITADEIWVIARRKDALEALSGLTKATLRPIPLDLCEKESFETLSALLQAEKPQVSLLVNAAGFGKFGAWHKVSLEDDLKMIDLNCKALVAMTRLVLPYMGEGSHVLQLDSLSAFQPVPYINTYAATKSFVLSYTRGLNRELKGTGIRMMAMNPGWVKTEFFDHAFQTNGAGEVQYINHLYEAKDVVATGLNALYRTNRDYYVHGLPIQAQVLLVKLVPHSIVMSIWQNQQKKPKNNKGLTTK
ncbi:MAG: SDR family NAD(P)-dependent oxidoreductase, partial [Ruminiclostridium sp.]|nr:SDR family NAD(P)-dependent oxidoreductase [Ruminiclostridium sp.]